MSKVLRCSFLAGQWVGWFLLHGHRKCASSLRWKCPRRWQRSPLLQTPASADRSAGRSGTDTGRTSPCSDDLAGYDGAASLQDGRTETLRTEEKTDTGDGWWEEYSCTQQFEDCLCWFRPQVWKQLPSLMRQTIWCIWYRNTKDEEKRKTSELHCKSNTRSWLVW